MASLLSSADQHHDGHTAADLQKFIAINYWLKRLSDEITQTCATESIKMIKVSRTALKAARELLEITQEELARACGLTSITVSRIESGAREPQAATIRKIVRALTAMGIEFSNGTGIGVRLDYKKAAAYKASQAENPPVEPDLG